MHHSNIKITWPRVTFGTKEISTYFTQAKKGLKPAALFPVVVGCIVRGIVMVCHGLFS
jgi:hypothetical protein